MGRIKQYLFYGDLDSECYRKIKDEIRDSNRRNLRVFTLIAFAAMLVMLLLSLKDPTLTANRHAYALSALLCLVLFLCAFVGKNHPNVISPAVYAFLGMLFVFGIILGTVTRPDQITVTFMILLFVAPLLFTDVPIRMISAISCSIIVYIIAAMLTQPREIFHMNLVDVLMYGVLSIIVSSYMMRIKLGRIHLETENRYLSQWDSLTGLQNRLSYENALILLRSGSCHAAMICAFDVNGLKKANDTLGHNAGDELLQGAADCIRRIFGPYGTCYRTGGDEFIAILDVYADPDMLLDRFNSCVQNWKGHLVNSLSVSAGLIPVTPDSNIDELLIQADKAMYAQKQAYYHKV